MEDTAGDNTFLKQAEMMMAERFQVPGGLRAKRVLLKFPLARQVMYRVARLLLH